MERPEWRKQLPTIKTFSCTVCLVPRYIVGSDAAMLCRRFPGCAERALAGEIVQLAHGVTASLLIAPPSRSNANVSGSGLPGKLPATVQRTSLPRGVAVQASGVTVAA